MEIQCRICKKEKNISEFFKDKCKKTGYRTICKKCDKEERAKFHKTIYGLISKMYSTQVKHSKRRGHHKPTYSKEELYEWCMKQKNFSNLYKNWEESDFNKELIPSCDRTDDELGYDLQRLKLVTFKENRQKECELRKSGIKNKQLTKVQGTHKTTKKKTIIFFSMQEAVRTLNLRQGGISNACSGRTKSCGDYTWEYINK